jgi:hypothetical protein
MINGTFSQRRQHIEKTLRITNPPHTGPDRERIEFRVGGVKRVIEVVREPCFSPRHRHAYWICPRCSQRRQHLYLPELRCRKCVEDGRGLVYEVRTISNDDRRWRAALFGASATKRKRRVRRSVEQRATEAALSELIKARAYLRPIDLLLVTERIRSAMEYVTGMDRLRLDREERGPLGMGPAPAKGNGPPPCRSGCWRGAGR